MVGLFGSDASGGANPSAPTTTCLGHYGLEFELEPEVLRVFTQCN
jgi:hypothetical protein